MARPRSKSNRSNPRGVVVGTETPLGANLPVGECGGKNQVSLPKNRHNNLSEGYLTMYEDKTLICRDCGAEFVFTAGEQAFYAEKGFQNEPSPGVKFEMQNAGVSKWVGDRVSFTRKEDSEREDFDKKRFAADHPDLYKAYLIKTKVSGSVILKVK